MPVCQNCKEKWTWKQTMKSLFKLNCPYCGKKQYESVASRKRTSIFILFPPIILSINLFLHLSWWLIILILFMIVTILWLIYPFMMKLSNEREPIW